MKQRHISEDDSIRLFSTLLAGTAQLVQRLATGWTIRESNPGAGEISAPVQTGPGAHTTS